MINEDQIIPYEARDLPVESGPWLVFAPHADDETFGMGGTLLKAADSGITTELVVMTDGALGGQGNGLVRIRQDEARLAAQKLGMRQPTFLGLPDRGLKLDEATTNLVMAQIKRVGPAAVFFPGVFELHPDHRTTAALVWHCLRMLGASAPAAISYEILTQGLVNTLIDISSHIYKKQEAMAIYASQLKENHYIEVATALNSLRSLTLPENVSHAEGFYHYPKSDLEADLKAATLTKIGQFFTP